MIKTRNCIFFLISFISLFQSCGMDSIEQDLVHLDRAFIPVWYYAQMGNFSQAALAFPLLQEEWNSFEQNTAPIVKNNKNWKSSTAQIKGWMEDTDYAIGIKDQELLLNQLDHARYELIDWRWRKGMEYYLDHVWDFEASLEVARSAALDPMLDLLEWDEFQMVNTAILISWHRLEKQNPDPVLFDLSPKEVIQFNQQRKELEVIINGYLKEASCLTTCEYENAISSLHFAYLSFVKSLGNFDSLENHYVKKLIL